MSSATTSNSISRRNPVGKVEPIRPATAEDILRKEVAASVKKAFDSGMSVRSVFDVLFRYTWGAYSVGEGK